MQDVRFVEADQFLQSRLGGVHLAEVAAQAGHGRRGRRAVEGPAVDRFLLGFARALLGRGEMQGLPTEAPLLVQEGQGAESIAAVQRNRVVEDVQYPQGTISGDHAAISSLRG